IQIPCCYAGRRTGRAGDHLAGTQDLSHNAPTPHPTVKLSELHLLGWQLTSRAQHRQLFSHRGVANIAWRNSKREVAIKIVSLVDAADAPKPPRSPPL